MNLVDLLIVIGFVIAFLDGWKRGLVALIFDIASFALSIAVALWLALPLGGLLAGVGLSPGLQPLVGFLFVLFLVDALLRWGFGLLMRLVPRWVEQTGANQSGGAALGVAKQAVVTAILTSLLLYLPIIPVVRDSIQRSTLGPTFAQRTPAVEHAFAAIIEPAVKELQEITTVTQITEESVEIDFPVGDLVIDRSAEQTMFGLVNKERRERGLPELTWSEDLADVGRVHSKDMWRRQYFSHVDPDGNDPFDRLDAAGISYLAAGENLALAPTTPIAHRGLMDSPGHRANILSPDYGELGIGAVRNGLYGIMYTQMFTD
ncbi:CvpA family protein [Candidatus Berkelbacteria bacterium]|nr:CvpA family protein [Candidatus Berkelbacteria bacterium]